MKEGRQLELKETITNTYLKTVSAYANYDGGVIVFGVRDSGEIVGLSDINRKCLDIENAINDSIKPQPDYCLEITNAGKTISLTVRPGNSKPYMYKSKAYKRNDTSTIEVDQFELKRLIMEGENIDYEELPSRDQNLTFSCLEQELIANAGIKKLTTDILKTLNLFRIKAGTILLQLFWPTETTFPEWILQSLGRQ